MITYEAFLGPNRPETLAVGQGPVGAVIAVVRQERETGEITWVGTAADTAGAVEMINLVTDNRFFGILCDVRRVFVDNEEDVLSYQDQLISVVASELIQEES